MAAIHEAGHLVVYRHFGVRVHDARIFRREGVTDPYEKTWGGQVLCDGREVDRMSRIRRAMIGVAGAVAEDIWCNIHEVDDYCLWEEEAFWEEKAVMSPTDWRVTGCAPGEPDNTLLRAVSKVHALLNGELRAELYATARRLIVEQREMDWIERASPNLIREPVEI